MSTSEDTREDCVVFMSLPGETAPVPCGRFEQSGYRRDLVGRFAYARSYLSRESAVPIDPQTLPLREGDFPPATSLGGIYGPLRDASPDAWGRRVIEYAVGATQELSEIQYLLQAGDDRPGALSFGPTTVAPVVAGTPRQIVDLPDLLQAAAEVEQGGPVTARLRQAAQLLLHGVTMGGAMPKSTIVDGGRMWLAKFPGRGDRFNMAAVEAGLLSLAEDCGIRVPEHHTITVEGRPVLMVERFDRSGHAAAPFRSRYLSGLTLLAADELSDGRWSYLVLAEEIIRRSSNPEADARELFARAVFNALVSNGDDHPRNHAIIAWDWEDWRLSPLFDVVPTEPLESREHRLALHVGVYGRRASRENLLSRSDVFRLTREEAGAVIDRQKGILSSRWEALLERHGATRADLEAVSKAIVPAGFEDMP